MLSLSLNHLPRPAPVATFRGHSEIVWSVVFLPNGRELVSASNDGSVRLWNLDHRSEVILGSSSGAVFCLASFPDGKRLASGGLDRSINVWDVDVLMAAADRPWKAHKSSVRYLDASSDGRYLASGSFDHNVNIWDTTSGQVVRDEAYLQGDRKINCVKFSDKDCRLLTGSGDGCLRIWDWESGKLLVGPMKADEVPIWAVAWSRDDTRILSGSSDGILRRWHASTGHIIGEPVRAHGSIIYSLSVSHNGGCVASASSDFTVKIWNTTTFELIAVLTHPEEVNCISFSTDDRLLATACSNSLIYIWEAPQASLDSGLVIDREYEGASLLEVSLTGSCDDKYYSRRQRPLGIPTEGDDAMEDRGSPQRTAGTLRDILGTRTPPLSKDSMDPENERRIEDVVPIIAERKRFRSCLSLRRRCRDDSIGDPRPMQRQRKLSQMIKAVMTKSRKFFNLW